MRNEFAEWHVAWLAVHPVFYDRTAETRIFNTLYNMPAVGCRLTSVHGERIHCRKSSISRDDDWKKVSNDTNDCGSHSIYPTSSTKVLQPTVVLNC